MRAVPHADYLRTLLWFAPTNYDPGNGCNECAPRFDRLPGPRLFRSENVKKIPCHVRRAGVALRKIVSIESRGLSRNPQRRSRPTILSARSIGFIIFMPVYAATSQMFAPPDAIRAVLNHIIFLLASIAIAFSSWCDWRTRRAGRPGILLHFPRHPIDLESGFADKKQAESQP